LGFFYRIVSRNASELLSFRELGFFFKVLQGKIIYGIGKILLFFLALLIYRNGFKLA
jgi:hypothetical protein